MESRQNAHIYAYAHSSRSQPAKRSLIKLVHVILEDMYLNFWKKFLKRKVLIWRTVPLSPTHRVPHRFVWYFTQSENRISSHSHQIALKAVEMIKFRVGWKRSV